MWVSLSAVNMSGVDKSCEHLRLEMMKILFLFHAFCLSVFFHLALLSLSRTAWADLITVS